MAVVEHKLTKHQNEVSVETVEMYDQQTGQGCHVIFCLMESNKCVRCAVRGEYFFNIIYVHVNVMEKDMNFFFFLKFSGELQ